MLDYIYEWGKPEVAAVDTDQARRQNLDNNFTMPSDNNILHGSTPPTNNAFSLHHHFNVNPPQHHPFFDPRAFQGSSITPFPQPPSMILFNPTIPPCGLGLGPGFLPMLKSEDVMNNSNLEGSAHRLGLNLGGRTYFPTCNDDTVTRLYRTKTVESITTNSPRCQAEGCNADLSDAKHYHRRHKVCEYHSKAATVFVAGLTQRFCQQCSRFHLLIEFDNGKRSCRKRLADHNRRRRKTQQIAQEIRKSQPSLDNIARSSPESGAQSLSSVKVAEYFQQRPNQNRGSSSSTTTSGSLFFSSG